MVWGVASGVHSLPHLLVCLKAELRVIFLMTTKVLLKDPNGCALYPESLQFVCFCSEAELQR